MKNKAGRKNKYDTHIKPYLSQIKEMAANATEKDIAKSLGVSLSTFMDCKNKHPELQEALRAGQQNLIMNLRSALIRKALGYEYEEKTISSNGFDKDGNELTSITIHKRIAHPDVGACHLLLKNYDKENWSEDWHQRSIKDQEIKLRQLLVEHQINDW